MNQIEIDKPKIIDYISVMNSDVVRNVQQDYLLGKIAEQMKQEIIKRNIEVVWKK